MASTIVIKIIIIIINIVHHLDMVLALASAFRLKSANTVSISSGLSINTFGTFMEYIQDEEDGDNFEYFDNLWLFLFHLKNGLR